MKMLSLFDGSGGFPLAAVLCGIEPVLASEIEPYPIAVTRSRFPNMKHIGDVSKINGSEIEPVDLITFGSPCQDLSVAGKRAGLKHQEYGDDETTRSGLFMEAVRIIKEMRESTNGKYPTFALWENVPGAFSSNKGEDFRIVLEELIKIVEPNAQVPPADKNRWPYADLYLGDGWSLAYRTLDAQYWGVPQRRRRIYLVADFRGERAGEILFKREGLRRHSSSGREKREGATDDAEDGSGAADLPIPYTLKIRSGCEGGGKGALIQKNKSMTLSTLNVPMILQTFSKERRAKDKDDFETWREGGVANTLNTFDNGDVRATDLVIEAYGVPLGFRAENTKLYEEKSTTITNGTNPGHHQGVVLSIDRAAFNQGENAKYDFSVTGGGVAQTIVARGPGAICYQTDQASSELSVPEINKE